MSKLELLKELESLISLQSNCLQKGDWSESDILETRIGEIEKAILEEPSQ